MCFFHMQRMTLCRQVRMGQEDHIAFKANPVMTSFCCICGDVFWTIAHPSFRRSSFTSRSNVASMVCNIMCVFHFLNTSNCIVQCVGHRLVVCVCGITGVVAYCWLSCLSWCVLSSINVFCVVIVCRLLWFLSLCRISGTMRCGDVLCCSCVLCQCSLFAVFVAVVVV